MAYDRHPTPPPPEVCPSRKLGVSRCPFPSHTMSLPLSRGTSNVPKKLDHRVMVMVGSDILF